jgi:hypothetical protein
MLSSKITKGEVYANFQDARRRHFGKSSACYKMGNYRPVSMKFRTQTNTDMLSSKIAKAGEEVNVAAATILEIQVNATKWAFIAQCR